MEYTRKTHDQLAGLGQYKTLVEVTHAIMNEDIEYLQMVLPYTHDLNVLLPGQNYTPLRMAFDYSPEIMKVLLEHGADPNYILEDIHDKNWEYVNDIMRAAIAEENTWAMEVLLDAGADPNSTNRKHGNTPLHLVTQTDEKEYTDEMIRLLLEYGADPSLDNDAGRNALVFGDEFYVE